MLLEPADEAGQRTLAQVDGVGQILHAELALVVLGEAVEHLELADAEPVPLAKLAFERCADSSMTRGQRPPRANDLRQAARIGLADIPGLKQVGLLAGVAAAMDPCQRRAASAASPFSLSLSPSSSRRRA